MIKIISVANTSKQWFLAERGIYPICGDQYYENTKELKEALRDYGIVCNVFGKSGIYAINKRR